MPQNIAEQQHQFAANEDVLWGVRAIAEYIGKTVSETQYLIRTDALPIGRLGPKTIFASKRQLNRRLTPKTA